MAKPVSRTGASILYFTREKRKNEPDYKAANERALAAANKYILRAHAQYMQDYPGQDVPQYSRKSYKPPAPSRSERLKGEQAHKEVKRVAKKKKKKSTIEVDETTIKQAAAQKKFDETEKGKTEKVAQHRDLTAQIVNQLKEDMKAGEVVKSETIQNKKRRNWFQRNVMDSVVGDVAGRALDIISRPSYATSEAIIENTKNAPRIILTDKQLADMAKKNPEGAARIRAEQEKEIAAAGDRYDPKLGAISTSQTYGKIGKQLESGITGKTKRSVAEVITPQINKLMGVNPDDPVALRILKSVPGFVGGLGAAVVTDPMSYAGIGVINKFREAEKIASGAKDLRSVGRAIAAERIPRSADEMVEAASAVAKETAAVRTVSKGPGTSLVRAEESAQIPVTEQLLQSSRQLDEIVAKEAATAKTAAEIRSASEGGYRALKAETAKQARRVANLRKGVKAGKVEASTFDEAAGVLSDLNTRLERANQIRSTAASLPVGKDTAALAKRVDDLKTIVKGNPGNKVAAATLRKTERQLAAAKIAAIPENAQEILKIIDDLSAGKEVKVTAAAEKAFTESSPNIQDQLLALIKEHEPQYTKAPDAVLPSAKLMGAAERARIAQEGHMYTRETLEQAAEIVSNPMADRSAKDIAEGVLADAADRGRNLTAPEGKALISKQLLGKMGEFGVEETAAKETAKKIKSVRELSGAIEAPAAKRADILKESLAEAVLPTSETADKILAEGLNKRFYIRFGSKDLGEFRPIGATLRAAHMPFELTGKAFNKTGFGQGFNKLFRMGTHFPGATEALRQAAEQNGIVTHSDFTKMIREIFSSNASRDELKQVTRAIENGYQLDGKLGELQQIAQEEIKRIFNMQADIGKYVPGAKADNYVYHYYRRGGREKIGSFKADRTKFLQAGKKGPTIEAAKAAGLNPLDQIDDILVMHHRDFIRDLQRSNYRQGVMANYGVLTDNAHFAAQQGLVEVPGRSLNKPFLDVAAAKDAKWYLPPEIADTFKAMDRMMEIGANQEGQLFLEGYNKATRFFKTSATLGNPGNWVNNTIGDFFLNWIDGVRDPRWYGRAIGLLRQGAEEFPKTIRIAGHDMSGIDLVDLFKRRAPAGGFIRTEGSGLARSRFVRGTQNLYEAREESVRLAHFLHALDQETGAALRRGYGWEKALDYGADSAARRVAKWNIDYTSITPFERQVRKWAIPFYTFMRKATPLMLEGMVTRPGKFVHYNMAKRGIEQMLGVPPEKDDGVTWPFWALQAGKMRLTQGEEPFFMKDVTPLNVINRITGGDQNTDLVGNILNQMNPIPKAVIETGTRRTLFNQRPITNWGQWAAGQIPSISIGARAAGNPLTSTDTQTPDRTVAEQILNLFGVPVQQMTYNRQRGEILRQEGSNKSVRSDFNKALAPYAEIRTGHSKTNGTYYNVKDLKTGKIIGRFRDYNMAARAASRLVPEAAQGGSGGG